VREQHSLGSGFVISPDDYIVTNSHVVGNAGAVTVSFSDAEKYDARVVGVDEKTDLTLLKIQPRRSLPTVALGRSADLQVGDWVVAIGNAFGLARTVTAGVVSGKGRVIGSGPYGDFIQTDAS
jgi:serine protease Do